jgi:hypothetical protein
LENRDRCYDVTSSPVADCRTVGGNVVDKACVFPFRFNGVTYNGCTEDEDGRWCSTKTDERGNHVTGNWGICSSNCPFYGASFFIYFLHFLLPVLLRPLRQQFYKY